MSDSLHHIRLLAGLEIESPPNGRGLDRGQAELLAGHLAADLARVVPEVESASLVVAATLFEPNELIRPGFAAWQALEALSCRLHGHGAFQPKVIAFGAHDGHMPDPALQPPPAQPSGHFLALPMLLSCPADQGQDLRERLESELFEKASIDPPARALLQQHIGLSSVHGQILTLGDLIALHKLQFDTAGLSGFWPVLEHALMEPDKACEFSLPGELLARWLSRDECVQIEFFSHDQARDRGIDPMLWLRACRTLGTVLKLHGVHWRPEPVAPVTLDAESGMMIEPAGPSTGPDGLTVHRHPDLGLVAWTVVEDGRVMHLYPLDPASADQIEQELITRGLPSMHYCDSPNLDPQDGRLRPATAT